MKDGLLFVFDMILTYITIYAFGHAAVSLGYTELQGCIAGAAINLLQYFIARNIGRD